MHLCVIVCEMVMNRCTDESESLVGEKKATLVNSFWLIKLILVDTAWKKVAQPENQREKE